MQVARLRASTRGKASLFSVWAERPATVGRSTKNVVRIDDPKVSRSHCLLTLTDGKIVVTDLGSSHGLVYRGQTFQTFTLEIGDGFHVGDTFIRFDGIDLNAESPDALAATLPPGARLPEPPRDVDDEDEDDAANDDDDDPEPPPDRWIAPPPPASPPPPPDDYPSVAPPRRSRKGRKKPKLVVVLFGWLLAFVMTVAATIAVLLFVKDKYGWDVYSLTGWLRETFHSDAPPPTKR